MTLGSQSPAVIEGVWEFTLAEAVIVVPLLPWESPDGHHVRAPNDQY